MQRLAGWGVGLLVVAAGFYGCVGDDPAVSGAAADTGVPVDGNTSKPDTSAPDASTPDTSTPDTSVPDTSAPDTSVPDTSVPDAHVPSCAGQPFGAPVAINTSQIAAAVATTVWGPRVVGGNAYFSAVPNGSGEQQVFRATFTPAAGGAPALSNATQLTPPSSTSVVEWAPTLSPDNSQLVFATGFPGPRQLAVSAASGGAFAAPTAIAALNTGADETDPYFANARALYFARDNASPIFEIYRSAVSGATFAAPVKVTLTCPLANCGTPVVTSSEGLLLFGAWSTGAFLPTVREAALTVTAGAGVATGVVDHPELGTHYPSWVSDDGCEVLLGGGNISTVADVAYAKRTPK